MLLACVFLLCFYGPRPSVFCAATDTTATTESPVQQGFMCRMVTHFRDRLRWMSQVTCLFEL